MPWFRVTSPDGRTFTIDAPQGATREEALAYAQSHAKANPKTDAKHPESWDEYGSGVVAHFLEGVLPGLARHNNGLGSAIVNAVEAPFSSKVDFHPVQAYRQGMAAIDRTLPQFAKTHPKASGTAEGTGMAAGTFLPATKVARGASRGQKMIAGAKTAGAYGSLSGALSSKAETPAGVLSDAVGSGEVSALFGSFLPAAGKFAGTLAAPFRPLTQPLVRMMGKGIDHIGAMLPDPVGAFLSHEGSQLARDRAQAAANLHLDRAIRESVHPVTGAPMRPAQVPEEVARRQGLGVPAVAGDLADPLRQRFGTAAKTPGPATMRVRQAIDERKQLQAARVVQHIADSLGPITNVEHQAETLNRQAREAARPLYDVAYAQPIPVTQEMQELFSRPVGRQALNSAAVSLQNEGAPVLTDGLIEQADGTWRTGQVPTMQSYDYAKTALDDTVFAGSSPFATPDATRDTRGARAVRSRLLEIMDGDGSGPPGARPAIEGTSPGMQVGPWAGGNHEAAAANGATSSIPPQGLNPYWKPARAAYAGPIQNRKALELGQEMARSGAVDVANRTGGLTGSQLDHFRLGHRSALASDVLSRPDYSDTAGLLVASEDQRQALAAVHGSEPAGALLDRLGGERDAAATWKAVRGGAPYNDGSLIAQDQRIEDGAHGVVQVLAGHPGRGVGNIVRALATGDRNGQEVSNHIARVLSEPNVGALTAAMEDVDREVARRALVEQRKGKAYQRVSRFLGGILGTNMTQPLPGDDPAAAQ